ncbi:MAG: DUF3631 domain-containing protein [Acidimicrobiales bacterium]
MTGPDEYGGRLVDGHAAKLVASAISPEVAAERGYVTADNKAQMERAGFGPAQRRPPALLVPLYGVTGELVGHQMRSDDPRILDGKVAKYETKAGQKMVLDVPPRVRPLLGNPAVPLYVTEGPLKADAAATAGLACVALLGVWSWRGRNADDGLTVLADWDYVHLKGRQVLLTFDSDLMLKTSVYGALVRLSAVLAHRGAEVAYVYLPGGQHNTKVGLDDWFAAGHGVDDLAQITTTELRRPAALPPVETDPADTFDDVDDETGAELADEVAAMIETYVALPSAGHLHACALWVIHTWVADAADSTPRLAVISAEKGSGKTRLLEVLDPLTQASLRVSNTTPAALYRLLAKHPRTILLDEADAVFGPMAGAHEDLRALLNAGHRKGATIPRCTGDGASMEVTEFPCYAPAAIAGIGDLPDTIMDRAVLIRMRRRGPDETVTPLRQRTAEAEAAPIARRLAAWAERNSGALAEMDPRLPDGVTDRPADVWAPLVAIADAIGGEWPGRARAAAVQLLAEATDDTPSLGVRLLGDLRDLFADRPVMATTVIVSALVDLEEAPWGDLRGKPLDARGLARRLRPYGVRSKNIREGEHQAKGYERADLTDAWARYLPSDSQISVPTVPTSQNGALTCDNTGTDSDAGTDSGTDRSVPRIVAVPARNALTCDNTAGTDGTDFRQGDGLRRRRAAI